MPSGKWRDALSVHATEVDVTVPDGGHLTGCAEELKRHWPEMKAWAVEPAGSPVISGGEPGPHPIQGIGAGFVPGNLHTQSIDGAIQVDPEDAKEMARRAASEEGMLVGISSGATLAAIAKKLTDLAAGSRVLGFIPLFIVSVGFWSLYQQQFTVLTIYSDKQLDRSIFGWEMPVSWVQSINPIFIIVLSGVFAALWTKLGNRAPSTPMKFGLAVIQVGLGFLVLVWGAESVGVNVPTPEIFIFLIYLLHTTGELCLSPVGLSAMNRLSPAHMASLIMGTWFFASATGNFAAGLIAAATGAEGVGEEAGKQVVLGVYSTVGWYAVAIGVGEEHQAVVAVEAGGGADLLVTGLGQEREGVVQVLPGRAAEHVDRARGQGAHPDGDRVRAGGVVVADQTEAEVRELQGRVAAVGDLDGLVVVAAGLDDLGDQRAGCRRRGLGDVAEAVGQRVGGQGIEGRGTHVGHHVQLGHGGEESVVAGAEDAVGAVAVGHDVRRRAGVEGHLVVEDGQGGGGVVHQAQDGGVALVGAGVQPPVGAGMGQESVDGRGAHPGHRVEIGDGHERRVVGGPPDAVGAVPAPSSPLGA